MIVFTVPMAHFRGIPTYLRERFGVPVIFYDGDVPMSLPEFGGMDTGFNYYHGADPSEYDLVVSNSEGGLSSLLELGAKRAEAVFWGADPEFFAPKPVEKLHDVFFYGYGDKFRRDWMAAMVGEPSRAAPELEFALGGRDFQGDTGRAWLVGDVPFNAFNQAISASRINLNITRRSHATVPGLVLLPAVRARERRRRDRLEPVRGDRALVRARAGAARRQRRRRGAHRLPRRCSTTRRRRRRWARGRASASSTSTRTPTGRGSCSRSSASASRQARVPEHRRVAIVPARNEEEAVAGVVEELRAFDPELDVVVIDDGSEDLTAERAAAAGAAVVSLPFNLGIGGAVQTGFKYALDHGYDTVIRLDGDGQHDPQQIPNLLAPLERDEADVVVGSRFAEGAGDYKPPFARRAGIRWFAQLVSLLTRQKLTDTTSGFQAVNARAIRLFAADYPHDYPEVEAAVMVVRHRLRILEVPAQMRGRETGRSSITMLRSLYYAIKVTLALLVGIFRRRIVPLEES